MLLIKILQKILSYNFFIQNFICIVLGNVNKRKANNSNGNVSAKANFFL